MNNDNKAYEELKSQNLKGSELLQNVINFEVEHSNHFESKVDLADFFLLAGEYPKAYEYSVRAESIVGNAPKGKYGKKLICTMYGDRAKLEYIMQNYDAALSYANKAITFNKEFGLIYYYTKAQILASQENPDDALKVFDSAYKTQSDNASSNDLRTYMYLLSNAERFEEAKTILEKYFESGIYYFGLGKFSSSIYEKCDDITKSNLCAFLDYEYLSCFEKNMKKTYDENVLKLETDFFVRDYIASAIKIESGTFSNGDIPALLSCEKHFSLFPSYYWLTYKAFSMVYPHATSYTKPLLEKIIELGANNIYINNAKDELVRLYSNKESQDIQS